MTSSMDKIRYHATIRGPWDEYAFLRLVQTDSTMGPDDLVTMDIINIVIPDITITDTLDNHLKRLEDRHGYRRPD